MFTPVTMVALRVRTLVHRDYQLVRELMLLWTFATLPPAITLPLLYTAMHRALVARLVIGRLLNRRWVQAFNFKKFLKSEHMYFRLFVIYNRLRECNRTANVLVSEKRWPEKFWSSGFRDFGPLDEKQNFKSQNLVFVRTWSAQTMPEMCTMESRASSNFFLLDNKMPCFFNYE